MIYAPITPQAMEYGVRAKASLDEAKSRCLTPYSILKSEMHLSNGKRCSIIVEYPFQGTLLSEAIYTHSRKSLLEGLEQFREGLKSGNISHNNLHADNIVVDNTSAWHCIRQYYTSATIGGDTERFDELAKIITRHAMSDVTHSEVNEEFAAYSTPMVMRENRGRVVEHGLVGFNNEFGRRVIECKYLWASDFIESRAVVTAPDGGMGLIDEVGNEIIEPRYEELDYDINSGRSWICDKGLWAEFDYNGKQLCDWGNRR